MHFLIGVGNVSQNALSWDDSINAFRANDTKDGIATKSKIMNIANGLLTADSTDAVNGGQLYSSNIQLAKFFGSGASCVDGTWSSPKL